MVIGRTMEYTIEDEINMQLNAAKQLRVELAMIKNRIESSGTLMNSVLIVQLKQIIRGLVKKYQDAGLLIDQNVTLVLSDKTRYARIRFAYSQGLQIMMTQIEDQVKAEIEAMAKAKIDEVKQTEKE
jgi:hypothetical protein